MATSKYRLGVIAGDGIGPEVVNEGLRVLECVAELFEFSFEIIRYPWSSQLYLDTGQLMPASAITEYRELDALYLGALGDPRVERGLIERSVLMTIRLELDLFVNLRPIVLFAEHLTPLKGVGPSDIDIVVVRENTEDAYVGLGGALRPGTMHELTIAEMVYTRRGVERAIRYAFELARARDKQRKLTLVDKSNAIRAQEIWRRVFAEVAGEYAEIATDAIYVDAAAMYLVTEPARFDVIVTTNLFGDILTDLGAAIQGGMGGAASANLHPGKVSLFEPIHGSAPDIAGRGVASPVGAIAAMAMLLDYIGETGSAGSINGVLRRLLADGTIPSLDARSGLTTAQVGDRVVHALASAHRAEQ